MKRLHLPCYSSKGEFSSSQ
ncbi:hypothetical protein Goarm_011104, partial [Gossypium armourianum]|nr:hypothetical protein [Gossypium armourianum]